MIQTFSAGVTDNWVTPDPDGDIAVNLPYVVHQGTVVIGYDMVNNIKRLETLPSFAPDHIFQTFFKPHTDTETKPVLKDIMYATYEGICRLAGQTPLPRYRMAVPSRMAYKEASDD